MHRNQHMVIASTAEAGTNIGGGDRIFPFSQHHDSALTQSTLWHHAPGNILTFLFLSPRSLFSQSNISSAVDFPILWSTHILIILTIIFFFFYIPTTHYSKRWTQHSSFRQILALIKRKSKRRSWIHVPWVSIQHISNPELPLEAGTDHWTHLKQINL